ncbi:MAG: hypothetical protein AUG51_00010 [Acidobacteria bacterium 13_1_20CM_3_53_8]|nr:MAG: hypothetical protein AUG51_00010 [Acidobacteria bacterium 13_1_20CM_3_53_8]
MGLNRRLFSSSSSGTGLTLGLAQVVEPGGAVELDIDGLDLALFVDVEVVDALDLVGIVAGPLDRDPAPADAAAVVEDVERLQGQRRLRARSGNEFRLGCEGWLAELDEILSSSQKKKKNSCSRFPSSFG